MHFNESECEMYEYLIADYSFHYYFFSLLIIIVIINIVMKLKIHHSLQTFLLTTSLENVQPIH